MWEAIVDPMVARLGEVLWVVDLNRQSLDRVVPDIAAGRLLGMFEAAGWHTETVKYGRRLRALFARDGGDALRARIDAMGNEEYQRLLRCRRRASCASGCPPATRRSPGSSPTSTDAELLATLPRPRRPRPRRPARRLPRGRRGPRPPDRHLRLHDQGLVAADRGPPGQSLGAAQPRAVRGRWRPSSWAPIRDEPWAPFDVESAEGRAVRRGGGTARARRRSRRRAAARARRARARAQRDGLDAAGARAPVRRPRPRGARGGRATSSPWRRTWRRRPTSAAGSTAAASGRIGERIDWFADDTDTLVRWRESDHGRHIELGIAEVQPRRPAGRARGDVEPRRPAAAAGRHDLRPVRQRAAGAVVVRHLRGRAVDPGRYAVGDHAGPRGWRAPVGGHAVDRDRAARVRRLGARLRSGLRVVLPARARRSSGARTAARRTSACPRDRSTKGWRRCRPRGPSATSAAPTCWPAATGCARARA